MATTSAPLVYSFAFRAHATASGPHFCLVDMEDEPRDLSAVNTAAAAAMADDLVVYGNPDDWKLLWKVSSKAVSGMFSIKRNAARGVYQFTWKLGAEVCEALVASAGSIVPVSDPPDYDLLAADDLVYSAAEHYYTVECAAESARRGFRKCTLSFRMQGPRGAETVWLAMTEERGKIAMATAITRE